MDDKDAAGSPGTREDAQAISSSLSSGDETAKQYTPIKTPDVINPDSLDSPPEKHQQQDQHQHDEALASSGNNGTAETDPASTAPPLRTLSRASSEPLLPPPPDGGLRAWTMVAMGWLVLFTTWGYINSFGSFQAYYEAALPGQPPSSISWIGSLQTWLTFIVGAFSGRLLDAGVFLPTLLVGACVQLLGIFLMSASTRYWQLLLTQGLLTGLGGGIVFTPSVALVATYFGDRRGLAVGLATTGNSVGGVVYPIVVRQLLPMVGFAWTVRVLGFINMTFFALALAFMRPRLPPRRSGPVIDWTAFREPVYVTYVAGLFFLVWTVYYTFSYVSQPYNSQGVPAGMLLWSCHLHVSLQIAAFGTQALGMSYHSASLLVTILNAAGVPFRVLVPFIGDRIGTINMMWLCSVGLTVVAFSWLGVGSIGGFYAFTIFYGVVAGAVQCLMPTGIAGITPRLDKVGTRLGMCFAFVSFAGLTGPPIGGALQTAGGGSFRPPQVMFALAGLMCCVLLFAARILRQGWDMKAKC